MLIQLYRSHAMRILAWSLLLVIVQQPLGQVYAQLDDDCEQKLQDARKLYRVGEFTQTISLLKDALEVCDLSQAGKKDVYELLGQAFLAAAALEKAIQAVRELLAVVGDDYEPPTDSPQMFKDIVARIKAERQVTQPEEGTIWLTGSAQTISWAFKDSIGTVTIRLSQDGGTSFPIVLAANIPVTSGSRVISVPNQISPTCRVRVELTGDPSAFALSRGQFAIRAESGSDGVPLWAWIGGGAVVTGTVLYFLLRNGNGNGEDLPVLPDPPTFP